MTKGEDSTPRALMIPFLAIHAKGGESKRAQSKRTAPSISNQVIGILKGNWGLRRRQMLPLCNSTFANAPSHSPFLDEKKHEHQRKGLRLWGESKSPK